MEGVCLEGRIEIAVIGGVMLGVGWKAVGGGCIYQSRPVVRNFSRNKREIGAAAHRWMDAKELACVASAAVHGHGYVCVNVILHTRKGRMTDRPAYCAALAEGGESMPKCQ